MSKPSPYLALLLIAMGFFCCNQAGKVLGEDELEIEFARLLPGVWELRNVPGAEEIWTFNENKTYKVKFDTEIDEGEWKLTGTKLVIDDKEKMAYPINMSGDTLKWGNDLFVRTGGGIILTGDAVKDALPGIWTSGNGETSYHFFADGTYESTVGAKTSNGKWELKDGKLVLDGKSGQAGIVSLRENHLTWGNQLFDRTEDLSTNLEQGLVAKGEAIKEHAFKGQFAGFGAGEIIPYADEENGHRILRFYLFKDGMPVYELPSFHGNESWHFDDLKKLAYKDLNEDGKKDLIVMTEYMTGIGPTGAQSFAANGVYLWKNNGFMEDEDTNAVINDSDMVTTVDDIFGLFLSPDKSDPQSSKTEAPVAKPVILRDDNAICQIRLGAYKDVLPSKEFEKVDDLGLISTEPADNGYTRAYLGQYIGSNTANEILKRVKARGFKEAYVIVDRRPDKTLNTYQIMSLNKLNLESFRNLPVEDRNKVFVNYGEGTYKISLGLYDKKSSPESENRMKNLAGTLGYKEGFSREVKKSL